jgi:hypothetical protein
MRTGFALAAGVAALLALAPWSSSGATSPFSGAIARSGSDSTAPAPSVRLVGQRPRPNQGEVGTNFGLPLGHVVILHAIPGKWSYLTGHGGAFFISLRGVKLTSPADRPSLERFRTGAFYRRGCAHKPCSWRFSSSQRLRTEFRALLVHSNTRKIRAISNPVRIAFEGLSFTGRWLTNFTKNRDDQYAMRLTQSGISVTGQETTSCGVNTIQGSVSVNAAGQHVLTGTWTTQSDTCTPNNTNDDTGPLVFTLSGDGNSFTGRWGIQGRGTLPGTWNGDRIG